MEHRTKKQHYIAQCIINIFIEDKDVFEKIVDKQKIYKTSVGNSMCHNNSYEYLLLKDNTLEKYFANNIDNYIANVLKKIIQLIKSDNFDVNEIYKEVCENLNYFIINYYKSISSLIRMGIKTSEIDQTSSITQMLFRIFNKEYLIRLMSIIVLGYKFCVIKSKEGNFIMSDQYISTCSTSYKGQFLNISSRDIGIRDTIILIPFNSHYYGMFYNGCVKDFKIDEKSINVLDDKLEKMINQVIYDNSTFKVLGTNADYLKDIKKMNNISGDITTAALFSDNHKISYKVKRDVFLHSEEYEFYNYWKSYKWTSFKKVYRNEKCLCGSNKKYKKCCKSKVDRCFEILNRMHYRQNEIMIFDKIGLEEPILMPASKNKEIEEILDNIKKNNNVKI